MYRLLLLVSLILTAQALEQKSEINLLNQLLDKPSGQFFKLTKSDGQYKSGDSQSFFNQNKNLSELTFDISNNKALGNIGAQGELKTVTIYRDSYYGSCDTKAWPGVWVAKDSTSVGSYSYQLTLGKEKYDLSKVKWDYTTELLDNTIPLTSFQDPKKRFQLKLISYAPMSQDGTERIRGLVYGLYLKNEQEANLSGVIHLPNPKPNKPLKKALSWANFDPMGLELGLGRKGEYQLTQKFDLAKGEALWIPAVVYMPGDRAPEKIQEKGSVNCLEETLAFYRKLHGRLQTPSQPYLAEFYERQIQHAFQAMAISAENRLSGSNWGSYPATRQIWIKDTYYSCLPFMMKEPHLAKKMIQWFFKYGVRPKGASLKGGVNHSISLSVASIALAGLYYKNTGDVKFLENNSHFQATWKKILDELIASRKDENIWLIPTYFISDGPIHADYHTGSNVLVWFALKSFSRLSSEVYKNEQDAKYYADIAAKMKASIYERTVVEGPFGKMFTEEINKDGTYKSFSDGEESDTVLMPFYGFCSYDEPAYLNYMKFGMSEHNSQYNAKFYAVKWLKIPATAPGYNKGLGCLSTKENLFGEHGYMSEIRKVTDFDGTVPWWPVQGAKKYGETKRSFPGKAAWFSGVYSLLYLHKFLGLDYDAPQKKLYISPLKVTGDYDWQAVNLGGAKIDLSFKASGELKITSQQSEDLTLILTLPQSKLKGTVIVNGKKLEDLQTVQHGGQTCKRLQVKLPAQQEVLVQF